MERVRRLAQFWNWLPAFRVVAESEHLPTAAEGLGISAPGLSRMVKLIESALGHELFERRARRLNLNERGQLFLRFVRDAMRRVDDGLQALAENTFVGELKIAASASASQVFVLPAIERLAAEHPQLVPIVRTVDEREVCDRVLEGSLDLALVEHTEVAEALEVEQLASFSYGIYCGCDHPLAEAAPTLELCLEHAFVAPGAGGSDAWPINLRRRVGLRVSALELALRACAAGRLLALLPDAVAATYGERLRRLDVGTLAEHPVFMVRRPLLGDVDRVAALATALRAVVTTVQAPDGTTRSD
jgi:DNA-binding transcriptional LysR family regulator